VNTYLQSGLDALADQTRMAIFEQLTRGPLAVHELAATMPVSRPAVSQHLRVLKDAGLVLDSKEGTRRVYQLSPEGIARLRDHFDRIWTRAMKSFEIAASQAPTSPKNALKKSSKKGEPSHARSRSRKSRRP
jgi:DNA-binding transcriptional ArsR family regulator